MFQPEVKNRKDFISVDRLTAISSRGDILNVGDTVKHDSEGDDTAVIESFHPDVATNDVMAQTNLGRARISYLQKAN